MKSSFARCWSTQHRHVSNGIWTVDFIAIFDININKINTFLLSRFGVRAHVSIFENFIFEQIIAQTHKNVIGRVPDYIAFATAAIEQSKTHIIHTITIMIMMMMMMLLLRLPLPLPMATSAREWEEQRKRELKEAEDECDCING